jgi:hypothetical protein
VPVDLGTLRLGQSSLDFAATDFAPWHYLDPLEDLPFGVFAFGAVFGDALVSAFAFDARLGASGLQTESARRCSPAATSLGSGTSSIESHHGFDALRAGVFPLLFLGADLGP